MTTLLALICFAANSLLCRHALTEGRIDASSFTTIRLAAGALVLVALMRPKGRPAVLPAVALFVYAASFSFAYDHVGASIGALLLFGAVQATMIAGALLQGEHLSGRKWAGLTVALAGLSYLLWPGLETPSLVGASLMLASGIAWGLYSLRGGQSDVALHFVLAIPLAVSSNVVFAADAHVTTEGALLAVFSGAVTSGLGYALWFRALTTMSTTVAATAQLAVPVLAAVGGSLFLSEAVTLRLVVATAVVLSGVALALLRVEHREARPRRVIARPSADERRRTQRITTVSLGERIS